MPQDNDTFIGLLEQIGALLEGAAVEVLLIGGFAVNHYGFTRATLDIDFLLAVDDLDCLKDKMIAAGFSNWSLHESVAFFQRPGSPIRVDFVQTDRQTMQTMLARAGRTTTPHASLAVPCLEDLLAMKLFSLKHGSAERRDRDMSDVVHLCLLNDVAPVATLLPLCQRYADKAVYDELSAKIKRLGGREQ